MLFDSLNVYLRMIISIDKSQSNNFMFPTLNPFIPSIQPHFNF